MKSLLNKYISFTNRFAPKRVIEPFVGLDIGASSCKAVELVVCEDSSREILNWAVEPLNELNVIQSVRKVLAKLNTTTKNFATAISGQGTLVRYIDMPRMSLEDLRRSVDVEADKHFPFPKDKIYTDCCILDPQGKDSKMAVLIAAAKKEVIAQRLKMLSEINLPSDFVGINAIALVNAFNTFPPQNLGQNSAPQSGKSNIIAILDIGDVVSNLIITKDSVPRFTRDIFIGGRELNRRIANALNVNMEEAEKIKCQPQDRSENVLLACDSTLINLASEIRLSFDYLATENNMQVSRLFATGGSAMFSGITDFLAKNLEIPVELWDPFLSLKLSPQVSRSEIEKNSSQLAVALGLALCS
ncbi:MAG: type IV pilus assembly protein PilM [Candidatus Omnitrophota bacterium]